MLREVHELSRAQDLLGPDLPSTPVAELWLIVLRAFLPGTTRPVGAVQLALTDNTKEAYPHGTRVFS